MVAADHFDIISFFRTYISRRIFLQVLTHRGATNDGLFDWMVEGNSSDSDFIEDVEGEEEEDDMSRKE